MVKRDIDEKMRLVMSNDKTHGLDKNLMAKITKIISPDHGETFGVIKNRLRWFKPEDVRKALDRMAEARVVKIEKTVNPRSKVESERFYFIG